MFKPKNVSASGPETYFVSSLTARLPISVIYWGVTNYPKTEWLQTALISQPLWVSNLGVA